MEEIRHHQEACYLIISAARALEQAIVARLSDQKISFQEYQVLSILAGCHWQSQWHPA